MDNPRLYLWIGLALLVWMNVVQWDQDNGKQAAPVAATATNTTPTAAASSASQLPALPTDTPAATTAGAPATAPGTAANVPTATTADTTAPIVHVVTDVLDLDISLRGGDVLRADLPKYPKDKQPGSPPVRLLTTDDATYSVARSGLARGGRPRRPDASRDVRERRERIPHDRQSGTAGAAHLDGRAGRRRHQDLRLQTRPVRDRRRLRRAERVTDRLEGRFVRAVRAPHVFAEALDVRRRELRLSWPGHLRRQEVHEARRQQGRRRQVHAVGRRRLDGRDAASLRVGGSAAARRRL